MSLADFLGSTSEIKIIDFLVENIGMNYNQTEISECIGISRTVVNQKIPTLVYNNIIEMKECKGNVKKYGLKENSIVKALISMIYDHSFAMADYEEDEKEILSKISKICKIPVDEKCDCYCGEINDINIYQAPSLDSECTKYMADSEIKWENLQIPKTSA